MFEAMNVYCNKSGRHLITIGDQITYLGTVNGVPVDQLAGLASSLDYFLLENDFFKEVPEQFKEMVKQKDDELIIDYQYFKVHLTRNEEPYVSYKDQRVRIVRGQYVNAAVFYKQEQDLNLAKGLLGVFDEPINPNGLVKELNFEKINELYHTYLVYSNHKVNNGD